MTKSPTGTARGLAGRFTGQSGPRASPLRRGLSPPRPAPPHTRQSGVYTHKQLGGGGDASLLGVGTHRPPAANPPLYKSHPLPAHTGPPTPALKTPRNPTANADQRRGSEPRLSFNVSVKTFPTHTRGPRDASSRRTRAPARGPRGPQTSAAADRTTTPCPPCPHDPRPGQSPARRPEELEPEPTPRPLGSLATASRLFRACQLNPRSAWRIYSPGPITPRRQE